MTYLTGHDPERHICSDYDVMGDWIVKASIQLPSVALQYRMLQDYCQAFFSKIFLRIRNLVGLLKTLWSSNSGCLR